MKNFLISIYLSTNSVASEKVSVGLLAITENQLYFSFSENKITLAAKLANNDFASFVKTQLKLVSNKVQELNFNLESNQLFPGSKFFEENFYNYLNIYSQNLIQFSKPTPVSNIINEESFGMLFHKFVGEAKPGKEVNLIKKQFTEKVNSYLNNTSFVEKADINYKVKPKNVPGIFDPLNVTFISKNGSFLTGQAINFNSTKDNITKHLYEYHTLVNALQSLSVKAGLPTTGEYKLIAEEPELNTDQHKVYEQLFKAKQEIPFSVIHPEDLPSISNQLEKGYSKFSTFIEEFV